MENTKLNRNEAKSAVLTAADCENGIWVTPETDEAMVLILCADNAMEVTISAGDGVLAGADLTIPFERAETKYVSPETGRYLRVKGEYAGKLLIKPSASGLTVGCLRLP